MEGASGRHWPISVRVYDRAMTIRTATPDDARALERLWREFELEVPPASHVDHDPEQEIDEIREIVDSGLAFLAEEDGAPVGFALARRTGTRLGRLTDLYVVPDARRGGVAAALVHAAVEALAAQGVEHLDLEVTAGNAGARAVYHRWGFGEDVVVLVAPVASLRERLAPGPACRVVRLAPRPDGRGHATSNALSAPSHPASARTRRPWSGPGTAGSRSTTR